MTFLDGQIMSRNVYEHRLSLFELKLGALKNHFFMEWNIANSDLLMVRPMRTKYSFINHCNKDNVALVKKENSHLIELVTTRPHLARRRTLFGLSKKGFAQKLFSFEKRGVSERTSYGIFLEEKMVSDSITSIITFNTSY